MILNPRKALLLTCAALACTGTVLAQGRGGRGGRGGATGAPGAPAPIQYIGGRFKPYPAEAVARGTTAYNSTCGYCHGDRAKGGNGGRELIRSEVALHDEDGKELGEYLKGAVHQGKVKLDLDQPAVYDLAAYLHSRIIYTATTRGELSPEAVLKAGDAKAGEAFFNGSGGCAKCHSVTGNLKGIGAKYDAVNLQDKVVNPRSGGRGGRGFGGAAAPDPNAVTHTVILPGGKTVKGIMLRLTDFDVTLRLDDGSTQTWTRENGIPKVDRTDPLQAHVDLMLRLKDKEMHDVTAYLATIK